MRKASTVVAVPLACLLAVGAAQPPEPGGAGEPAPGGVVRSGSTGTPDSVIADTPAGDPTSTPVLGALPDEPPAGTAARRSRSLAPLRRPGAAERRVDDQYVVVLRKAAAGSAPAARRARAEGVDVRREFRRALPGFTARMDPAELAEVRSDPDVVFVEQEQVFTTDATQQSAPWGLDRTDQQALPLSGTYTYQVTGSGVTAYVLDTGVRADHTQLNGRVAKGYSAISDGRGTGDCDGHGTHVAGIIGGSTYGVAKEVTISPVRVLNCSGRGTTSSIIAGLDWIASSHTGPSVANLSLGGGTSAALDAAVRRAVSSGVTVTVAAGNDRGDSCRKSPARVTEAVTVGATNNKDSRDTRYSAVGACLDLFAPGTSITSSVSDSTTATATMSGTSMASPFVAGAAALYLQRNPSASPAAVSAALVGSAARGVVTNAGSGSPNLLLNTAALVNAGAGTTAATTPASVITTSARTSTAAARTSTSTTRTSTAATRPVTTTRAVPTSSRTTSSRTTRPLRGATRRFGAGRIGPVLTPAATCTGAAATYQGAMRRTGAATVEPGGTYYSASTTGVHRGCLSGAATSDFDLALYRWNGSSWRLVAAGTRSGSAETVTYRGSPGYYFWRVVSYRGAGDYTLSVDRP